MERTRAIICNELKDALDIWNNMNERLAHNLGGVTEREHMVQRQTIDSLVRELQDLKD